MKIKLLFMSCGFFPLFCLAQFSVKVIMHIGVSSPMPQTFYMSPCYGNCITINAQVTGGTEPYTYSWHNISAKTDTTIYCKNKLLSEDTIWVTVQDASGNRANDFHRVLFDHLQPQSICIVTVDSASGKNLIVWDQATDGTIVSYNIYKETTTSGIYAVIKNVPKKSFSTFIDSSSNPSQKAARYKITTVDTCGAESNLANTGEAKTIHLTVNAGIFPAWNLAWDYAEGFSIVKYRIWRATSSAKPVLIDSIQSSLTSYTDLNPPSGVLYYILEALTTADCNPSLKMQSGNSLYNSSFSNVANNSTYVGISENNFLSKLNVFPIPSANSITIHYSSSVKDAVLVNVKNTIGQILFTENNSLFSGEYVKTIDLTGHPAGFYFIELFCGKENYNKKIVLQ